jgi:hypothetical protein
MGDNEVRNKVVTEFSAEGMSSFASSAIGAGAALGAVALGQHLFNQALAAAAAPINTIIQLNVQRENQIRSMTNALIAQQAIGGTRAQQALADQVMAGTAQFTARQIAEGTRQYADLGAAAESAFRKASTSQGTFLQATNAARSMMRQMVVDAAALPGEVNDYATAMQIASSSVIQAVAGTRHSNTSSVMGMINNITASAINAGIDSAQAGRDIMRMMSSGRGQAGLDVRTWTEVIAPYARRINASGQATGGPLQAGQFNTMTGAQRFETLMAVGNQMRNIMNMSADSWDAVIGALNSARDELIQQSTQPIYQMIQTGLARFSAWLNEGVERGASILQGLQRIGTMLSEDAVMWFAPIIKHAAMLGEALGGFVESLTHNAAASALLRAFDRVSDFIQGALTTPMSSLTSVLQTVAFVFSIFNPAILLAAGFLHFLSSGTAQVASLFNGVLFFVVSLGAAFMALQPAFDAVSEVLGMLWETCAGLIGGLAAVVGGLIYGAAYFVAVVAVVAAGLATYLLPVITLIVELVMFFVDAIVTFGRLLFEFVEVMFPGTSVISDLMEGFRTLKQDSLYVARAIREAFEELKSWIGIQSTSVMAGQALGLTAVEEHPLMARMRAAFARTAAADGSQTLTSPRNRAVSSTHNDFRFSRFDITQRFAEGFDPDRIATFFQRDIANAANQRLEGGFAPAFTT